MNMKSIPTLALCITLAVPTAGLAQYNAEKMELTLPRRQVSAVERSPDRFLQTAVQSLFRVSSVGDLTKDSLANYKRLQAAKNRARLYSQVFAFDLDGDLAISADEVVEQMPYQDTRNKAKLTGLVAGYDMDKDGGLSQFEIMEYAAKNSVKSVFSRNSVDYLFSFDLNGDGTVRAQEIADMLVKIKAGEITVIEEKRKAVKKP